MPLSSGKLRETASGKAVFLSKKVVGVAGTLFIINMILMLFFREVFTTPNFSITILLLNLFLAADRAAQPFFTQKGKKDDYRTLFAFLLFLFALPFLVAFPYIEYSLILRILVVLEVGTALWMLGTLMIEVGGITLVASRIVLGVHGSVRIGIEENHKLITNGPYHTVRHPIYAGSLFLFLGYSLSFSSVLSSIIILLIIVPLSRGRMALEEKL